VDDAENARKCMKDGRITILPRSELNVEFTPRKAPAILVMTA